MAPLAEGVPNILPVEGWANATSMTSTDGRTVTCANGNVNTSLTGVKIGDTTPLRPGLYVSAGRKFIVR